MVKIFPSCYISQKAAYNFQQISQELFHNFSQNYVSFFPTIFLTNSLKLLQHFFVIIHLFSPITTTSQINSSFPLIQPISIPTIFQHFPAQYSTSKICPSKARKRRKRQPSGEPRYNLILINFIIF